ncbi:hypothetical protein [Streptomyces sp. NPDC059862]|uniref:hypothetical protein n=1 Tax=unclassified Streptomyces TaxID=2593676 RepID=UPI00363F49D4
MRPLAPGGQHALFCPPGGALVWADGGYTGSLVEYCLAAVALVLTIVKRSDDQKGFVVLPNGGSSSGSSLT